MPWVAVGFNTLYLQLLGFSDMRAAVLQALFLLGASLGSFGGGYVGEIASPMTGYSDSSGLHVAWCQQGQQASEGVTGFWGS